MIPHGFPSLDLANEIRFGRQWAGGKAELLVLSEIGIMGSTHMLMQDDNSLDIADILLDWIGKHVTAM
jgi:hypothetical protein